MVSININWDITNGILCCQSMLKSNPLYSLREIKEVMYSLNQKINKDTKKPRKEGGGGGVGAHGSGDSFC